MAEPLSLIDNSKPLNPVDHSTEPLAPADKFPSRRINFHLATKPFTNGGGDGNFRLETLNPTATSCKNQQSVGGGYSDKKRDASELENGSDQELSFGIPFRRIGAGLENLGNTCFLNSVLQCLTYTEPLAAYLQSGKHQVTCRKSGFCALCAIQKHVSRALQLSGRSLAPKDLVSNLRFISRNFRNSRQEDAHEYMVNLLESMHKCCLPNGVPSESQSAYDNSLVHRIFGGRLCSQVKCMQCNHCSNKFDPFLDLSLEILKADSLYKAFANFTAKEQLDGGAKQYECQQCKQKVKALKQLTVYKAPNVLTVHLKRFGFHTSGQKIDKKVHFGPTLDLKPFVTGPYDGDLKYTLYGVLVHAGLSTHSGHYYCFVRTSSGLWYSLDDNRVFQVSEKKVFEQKAYMLFYFKDRKNFPSRTTDVAHQKPKIVNNGTPNGHGAEREAQLRTGLSNGSVNAQTSLRKTANVAQQKEKIVMNGTPNEPNAPKEAQVNVGLSNGSLNAHMSVASFVSSFAPREAQTNTVLSNGSINSHKSLVSVSNGSSNEQKSPSTVGIERNVFGQIAPQETQTNPNLSNWSLPDQKSSVIDETMMKGHITGAPEPEQTETKEASVPKSISEPSKTEDQKPGLLKMDGSMEKKTYTGKPRKKAKNFLQYSFLSMKFSSNVFMRTSLNQRKKKKHKRNKQVKNLAQKSSVNKGPSSSFKIKARELFKPVVDNEFKERADLGGAVLGSKSTQKDFIHMLTRGRDEKTVRRWDGDESAPSQTFGEEKKDLTIGYTGDEWDEEYDRGKRKKVRISRTEFDGRNSFQDTANERLKSRSEKQNLLSKRPPMKMMMKKKNKHLNMARSGNRPFRI